MRVALSVIVAFIVMAVVVFSVSVAPWFIFGIDAVLQPGRFDTTASVNVYAVVVGFLGAVFAGWLCARIARARIAVLTLAVLCCAAGVTNALAQQQKPEPGVRPTGLAVMPVIAARKEPAWFTWLMPCLGVPGVLLGGRRLR